MTSLEGQTDLEKVAQSLKSAAAKVTRWSLGEGDTLRWQANIVLGIAVASLGVAAWGTGIIDGQRQTLGILAEHGVRVGDQLQGDYWRVYDVLIDTWSSIRTHELERNTAAVMAVGGLIFAAAERVTRKREPRRRMVRSTWVGPRVIAPTLNGLADLLTGK